MSDREGLDAEFLTEVAARLAGRDWPAVALASLTQGAGHGLVSALDDLLMGLQRLADEDLAEVVPRTGPFQETGQ